MRSSEAAKETTRVTGLEAQQPRGALDELKAFLQSRRMSRKFVPGEFEAFEREVHERVMRVEREVLAEEMASSDVEAEAIVVDGKTMRRVLRSAQTYMTSAGEVTVERWLYKDRTQPDSRAVSPLEERLGVIDFWTPQASKQALWAVTQMTPGTSAELFRRVGNMSPSKSSLDRLAKRVSERWEANRSEFECALQQAMEIPPEARSVVVSLDGVMAPMKPSEQYPLPPDPIGLAPRTSKVSYKEVGCATLSFCDSKGDLLAAIRFGRAPGPNKQTVKASLLAELANALSKQPNLAIVKVADGAQNNWEFLSEKIPEGHEVIDFFHAADHLHAAIAAIYGDQTRETRHRFEALRDTLRDDERGVEKVIRALDHLRRKPKGYEAGAALRYFRKHRHRMRYAELKAKGLAIGSGVMEAACKTLVSQRLKLSGMRWSEPGAQAILTMRGWQQSERFDQAWALIAATYQTEIHLLANVVPLRQRVSRASR